MIIVSSSALEKVWALGVLMVQQRPSSHNPFPHPCEACPQHAMTIYTLLFQP